MNAPSPRDKVEVPVIGGWWVMRITIVLSHAGDEFDRTNQL
jgi:hypothetical protein